MSEVDRVSRSVVGLLTMAMLTLSHMRRGEDEDGKRVRMFTARLTGERALRVGVGKFKYQGGTMEGTETGPDGPTDAGLQMAGRVRHGYGEIVYDSGNWFKGEWLMGKRSGLGTQ